MPAGGLKSSLDAYFAALSHLRRQANGVNIFMLKMTVNAISANNLIFSVLQNVSFCLAERRILEAETTHIALQSVLFQSAIWHIREIKEIAVAF